jgi:hypothetical protein
VTAAIIPACAKCAHSLEAHSVEGLAPQCTTRGCDCLRMVVTRPATATTPGRVGSRPETPGRCGTCGHGRQRHEISGFAPGCVLGDCTCEQFKQAVTLASVVERPATPVHEQPPAFSEPATETPGPAVGLNELLQRGRDSELKPINRLVERIEGLVEDLRERLAAEAAADGVKAAIAKLEKKLAAEKGRLRDIAHGTRTRRPASSTAEPGDHACPDCPKTFTSVQGVTMHRTRSHGYRKTTAS